MQISKKHRALATTTHAPASLLWGVGTQFAAALRGDGTGPGCSGAGIIAFITHSADIGHILDHIGVDSEPPHISPARAPPLWDGYDAQTDDGVQIEPDWTDWSEAAQPAPDYEVDQRIHW